MRALQEALQGRGLYAGPVDGRLSPATRVAIVTLEREAGLEPTGALTPEVARRLSLPVPSAEPSVGGERGARGVAAGGEARQAQAPGVVGAPVPSDPQQARREREAAMRALEEARDEALRLLEVSAGAAEDRGLDSVAEGLARAEERLRQGRAAWFERSLRARKALGWPPLPEQTQRRLERALERRALLVGPPDGRLGPDDRAALRWLERRLGLPVRGEPSLPVLDALGVAPGSLDAEGTGASP